MWFESYKNDVLEGNGVEWIDWVCERWLHLDWAEYCAVDYSEKHHYSYCIAIDSLR